MTDRTWDDEVVEPTDAEYDDGDVIGMDEVDEAPHAYGQYCECPDCALDEADAERFRFEHSAERD